MYRGCWGGGRADLLLVSCLGRQRFTSESPQFWKAWSWGRNAIQLFAYFTTSSDDTLHLLEVFACVVIYLHTCRDLVNDVPSSFKSVMKYVAEENWQVLKERPGHSIAVMFVCTIRYNLYKPLDYVSKTFFSSSFFLILPCEVTRCVNSFSVSLVIIVCWNSLILDWMGKPRGSQ